MLLILLVLCSSLINHLLEMSQLQPFDLQNWGVGADLVGRCSPGRDWGCLGSFPSHLTVKPSSQLHDTAAGL